MKRRIIQRLPVAIIATLCAYAASGQTHSNCEPSPPMPPNAKPGISGLTLSREGKTLLVAAGDGKIRFVDLDTGEVRRTLTSHTNLVYIANLSPDKKLLASSSRDSHCKNLGSRNRSGTAHARWLSLCGESGRV